MEQAIKPLDGKALISAPKGTESEYQECIKNLKARYDQPRKIYRAHVHEVMDHSTPYTREGYYKLDTLLQDAMAGMSLYGGKDAGSVLVAIGTAVEFPLQLGSTLCKEECGSYPGCVQAVPEAEG